MVRSYWQPRAVCRRVCNYKGRAQGQGVQNLDVQQLQIVVPAGTTNQCPSNHQGVIVQELPPPRFYLMLEPNLTKFESNWAHSSTTCSLSFSCLLRRSATHWPWTCALDGSTTFSPTKVSATHCFRCWMWSREAVCGQPRCVPLGCTWSLAEKLEIILLWGGYGVMPLSIVVPLWSFMRRNLAT